jgi:hypothetical protein
MARGAPKKSGKSATRVATVATKDYTIVPTEYVRAENNLETIGYFDAGYHRRYPKPREAKDILLSPDRIIRVIASATYGYPNTEDLDFYRAFLKICDEIVKPVERWKDGKRTIHPHFALPVRFSTRQLLRYSGRKESARERKAAREWIKRQTFTGIEGAVYLAKQGAPAEHFAGTLFHMTYCRGERMKNGKAAEANYVWHSAWFLSNYYYHYFKPIDLAFHQRLRRAIAKGLYPLLDQGWYASDGRPFSKRYQDITSLLAIPSFQHLSRIKQQLDPAHSELLQEHFLANWEYRQAANDQKWIIVYYPGEKFFQDQQAREVRRQLATQMTTQMKRSASHQLTLLDQSSHLLSEILVVCGDTKNKAAYQKVIRESPEGLLWMVLSETRQAEREGRITKSKGAYFMDTLAASTAAYRRRRDATDTLRAASLKLLCDTVIKLPAPWYC